MRSSTTRSAKPIPPAVFPRFRTTLPAIAIPPPVLVRWVATPPVEVTQLLVGPRFRTARLGSSTRPRDFKRSDKIQQVHPILRWALVLGSVSPPAVTTSLWAQVPASTSILAVITSTLATR